MTVSSSITTHSYIPAGAMLSESLAGLVFINASDLVVTDPAAAVQVLGTDYEITGNGRTGAASIRTLRVYGAGIALTITRITESAQLANIQSNQPLPAEAIETELDRRALIEQEGRREVAVLDLRALKVPKGEVAGPLPSKAAFAGKFLAGDALGNPIASSGPGVDAGLRTDLANPIVGPLIVGVQNGTLESDLNNRGKTIAGRTLTAPMVLATNANHIGTGRLNPLLMTNGANGLVIPQPLAGDYNYFSETSNFFVRAGATMADSGDYANDIRYSAYQITKNNKFWEGQVAAQRFRNAVGHMSIGDETSRSPIGQLFEIEGGIQSTVLSFFGSVTELVDTAIKVTGRMDFLSYKNRAFDKFNKLFANDGPAYGAVFDTCWFEEYGPGTVNITYNGGGKMTAYSFNAVGGGVLDLGSAKAPYFSSPTFVQPLIVSGGYAPILYNPHCVSGSAYFLPNGFARGVHYMKWMTGPQSGRVANDAVGFTLPEYGEAGTMLEHYGISSSHTSLAVAELAGIGLATGLGHTNAYSSEINGAAWTVTTATLTAGLPDPWGGTTAFALSGTAGQRYSNFFLPAFTGGGKGCIQFLARAQAADSYLKLRIESTGANAYKRENTHHFTDTRWRIITLRFDAPASGDYYSSVELLSGTFVIAATQVSAGYDAKPLLRGGQSVTGTFIQDGRRIIQQKSAIPVAGKYWAGDEIEYDAASAAARKRRGALCTVGDGSSVGTWVETGIVASTAGAIASPAATVADLKIALDAIRAVLTGVGLTA